MSGFIKGVPGWRQISDDGWIIEEMRPLASGAWQWRVINTETEEVVDGGTSRDYALAREKLDAANIEAHKHPRIIGGGKRYILDAALKLERQNMKAQEVNAAPVGKWVVVDDGDRFLTRGSAKAWGLG